MPAFLLEIGLEEIPASMIAAAQAELAERVRKLLTRERLATDDLQLTSYSTPRRLAVLVEDLLPKQADLEEEVVGPSLKVAFKDGAPTPAAIAFAKKSGVEIAALQTIQNAKGEYVAATVRRQGRSAAKVLTDTVPAEIAGIYWPKSMYWRAGKPERFVRPVRWMLALLDEEVLPIEFAGVTAGGVTYGHRILHGEKPVVIRRPQEYVEKLAAAYVQVDPEARRHRIRKALDAATRQVPGARWREDEDLVDIVTNLTEWPSVILGSFDPLGLPKEVLITVMRDHQKYFALEDANGKLLPNFLAVLNVEVDEAGANIIRHGNERVLRARFNDARFFWDMDQKIPLVDRVEMLKSVTFHKDLGSYYKKTERIKRVAEEIYTQPSGLDHINDTWISKAASLAKADLTTEMVKEFPELQGVMGGLYAKLQGFNSEISDAIYGHYKPISASDSIPATTASCVLAIADKMSTIVDMFAIGLQPTGSKDPFSLRRAGNGVMRILVEDTSVGSSLPLESVYLAAMSNFRDKEHLKLRIDVFNFMLDRFEFYLRESRNIHQLVASAIRKAGVTADLETPQGQRVGYQVISGFAEELNSQIGSPEVIAVAGLLKRASNILRQAKEKGISHPSFELNHVLQEQTELELARMVTEADEKIHEKYREKKYKDVIAAIAALQAPLDAFFDSVMVMVDDSQLRANRLALLARTESTVRWAADFSELASIQ